MEKFWKALDQFCSLSAVSREWRELLGEEYGFATQFLQPRQELALAYPCQRQPRCGCYHEVVEHGPDDCVAVCVCRSGACDPIPVRRIDLVVYEVNLQALATAVASALDLTPAFSPSGVSPNTVHLGLYYPHEGFRFAVYLSLEGDPNKLADIGAILTARNDRPFILFTPTREPWSDHVLCILNDRKHELLALADVVEIADGELRRRPTAGPAFARFHQAQVIDAMKVLSPKPFLIPTGTTWPEVIIRVMIDTDRVLIHVGEKQWASDYHEMGMVDKRKRTPDEQWKLLLELAHDHGHLRCERLGDAKLLKQTVRRLRKTLQALIPIPGDPLPFDRVSNEWRTKFHVGFDNANLPNPVTSHRR